MVVSSLLVIPPFRMFAARESLGLPDGEVETMNDRGVVGNLLLSRLKRLAQLLLAPSYNESRSRNRVLIHYCISLFRVLQT